MKVVVSGGGTGGHVYPALTVLEAFLGGRASGNGLPGLSPSDVLWIGSQGGMEEGLVRRAGLEFKGLAAGGLRGVGLVAKIRNSFRIATSVSKARSVLAAFEPDVVLVTGGYACVAVTLGAWLRNVPVVIYLPDIVPGLAVRFLSQFAERIAVTSEESYHYFRREKVTVTGYPVRSAVYQMDRTEARQSLGLNLEDKTVLVFGGSRGARSINRALVAGLRELLQACQIVHISGRLDNDWVTGAAKQLPEPLRKRYQQHAYLHDMPQALVAADLAVARAGAATLGELPAAQLPSVLIPYPHSGQHQMPNAQYMQRNGAARVLLDEELEEKLVPTVLQLVDNDEMLSQMKESARAMARPDAAGAIAEELWALARRRIARRTGALP
ncbi:MAG: undecaprenyldiphospho-muramoylpentapeptide beta-N-acetylglucosaminyltransferase [Anaerolineae bacterium]|jgi:UDP-N-acetylglucosamine--N-acetylmuramyl-(pentapeptide) pyrophosphoryl-undecaprenol N-acetylglucosamine transferase